MVKPTKIKSLLKKITSTDRPQYFHYNIEKLEGNLNDQDEYFREEEDQQSDSDNEEGNQKDCVQEEHQEEGRTAIERRAIWGKGLI